MPIWTEFSNFISHVAATAFSGVVETLRAVFQSDPEQRRRVAFSVAIIALSAKMAKADGIVSPSEVEAFREIFHVPQDELRNVARLYDLAKRDVAGFDAYADQVRSLFPGDDPADAAILHDVLDALFHIAKADELIHENELLFLEEIAVVFGFTAQEFERIAARHVDGEQGNPYAVLGADPAWDFATLKAHYRQRVAESHPDRLIARGVPQEFVVLANDRLAAINTAWDRIKALHGQGTVPEPVIAV
ncbi:MAG: DnaJ family molecular chaperone [Ahrensia sp.]|nr:DnaJ family molecular chaperone [Ahrensia sp.]